MNYGIIIVKIMKELEKALVYVRTSIDMEYINKCIVSAMEMRCPFSLAYPLLADDISDLLEEYGEDNDLPEGWWCEYGDIDDIIAMI